MYRYKKKDIYLIFVILLFILPSCQENNKKKEIEKIVKSWQEKEIIFPEGLIFTKHGKDTIGYNIPASEYKITKVSHPNK